MNLKKYIKQKSQEIGIDIIGFTDAEDFVGIKEKLQTRRNKNYETEFEERDISLRVRPKEVLPQGKSIIVIGMSYYINVENKASNKNSNIKGKISKSSLGLDYHVVLKDKMEKLAAAIKGKYENLIYQVGVDTTPILDRHLAKKAGVGWYGKNSNIINDKYGSFIFLGYIITNLEIEQDEMVEEKCCNCEICIKSCPTKAIKPNNQLDATRCISYLTQTKENIPYELRRKMANKIYGCDTCQLVCPKNNNIIKTTEKVSDQNIIEYIDIEELFFISNKEFKEKYGDIAFSWRGKNVIKRNGIIAMGNSKDKKHIKLLEQGLKDPSAMIRKYSAWSLLEIDQVVGLEAINSHIKYEKDKSVIEEIKQLKLYFKILED